MTCWILIKSHFCTEPACNPSGDAKHPATWNQNEKEYGEWRLWFSQRSYSHSPSASAASLDTFLHYVQKHSVWRRAKILILTLILPLLPPHSSIHFSHYVQKHSVCRRAKTLALTLILTLKFRRIPRYISSLRSEPLGLTAGSQCQIIKTTFAQNQPAIQAEMRSTKRRIVPSVNSGQALVPKAGSL